MSRTENMIGIYDYEKQFVRVFRQLKNEFSKKNFDLVQQYDRVMVNESLAKATRLKQIKMILSLTRLLQKDWNDATKPDIDDLVYNIMKKYASELGQETETSSLQNHDQ